MWRWKSSLDIALPVWAAVGPLMGVMLGSYLAMRTQRKHWVLDNKKEEYRELLGTLTRAFDDIIEQHALMVAHGPEEQRKYMAAEKSAMAVIRDRIFIAREIEKMKLLERWTLASMEFDHDRDGDKSAARFGAIRGDIVRAAERITR